MPVFIVFLTKQAAKKCYREVTRTSYFHYFLALCSQNDCSAHCKTYCEINPTKLQNISGTFLFISCLYVHCLYCNSRLKYQKNGLTFLWSDKQDRPKLFFKRFPPMILSLSCSQNLKNMHTHYTGKERRTQNRTFPLISHVDQMSAMT